MKIWFSTQSPPDVADCDVAVEGRSLQSLLENDRVDVWAVRGDSADLRLPRSFFEEQISSKYPECFVLNPSVEALVQQAEKEAFKRSNLTAEWHEEYVSGAVTTVVCVKLAPHSVCVCACVKIERRPVWQLCLETLFGNSLIMN